MVGSMGGGGTDHAESLARDLVDDYRRPGNQFAIGAESRDDAIVLNQIVKTGFMAEIQVGAEKGLRQDAIDQERPDKALCDVVKVGIRISFLRPVHEDNFLLPRRRA
jgi:hypothetical protein